MHKANWYDVIKRPIITEKSTILGESRKYVFEILPGVPKPLVKKAVEAIFEVKVAKVNVLTLPGKVKRFRGRKGTRSDVVKAIVTLEKDFSIDYAGGIK